MISFFLQFIRYRGKEILLHQLPFFLGGAVGVSERQDLFLFMVLLPVGLTVFFWIYLYNDFIDRNLDLWDPKKPRLFENFSPGALLFLKLFLYLFPFFSLCLFIFLSSPWIFFIFLFGFLYSAPGIYFKGKPFFPLLLHFFGGTLYFLFGYTPFSSVDLSSFFLAIMCGLLFSAGNLTQELRDYDVDTVGKLHTTAIYLGKRGTYILSAILLFSGYLLFGFFLAKERTYLLLFVLFFVVFFVGKVWWEGYRNQIERQWILRYQSAYRAGTLFLFAPFLLYRFSLVFL